ncbi:MAG: hypothetical protein DI582_09375 [Azospirillum brasilense]|nr:MAG: hypothetical protein DI582_09375 [Azospirillum brasilense]
MRTLEGTAARLNERLTIEQPTHTDDGQGGQVVSWGTLGECWAAVTPVYGSGRETARAGQAEAVAGYRVQIRRREDVLATMRLRWRNRILWIHSLHEQEGLLSMLVYEEQL